MKARLFSIALLISFEAIGSTFSSCILDKMPGVSNDAAASAVYAVCTRSNPGQMNVTPVGAGRGLFGFNDPESCIIKKSQGTTFPRAAFMISAACRCLYREPAFDREMCAYPTMQN